MNQQKVKLIRKFARHVNPRDTRRTYKWLKRSVKMMNQSDKTKMYEYMEEQL